MENNSGIRPVEFKVLIRQDKIEEVTSGGIVLPGQVTEKEQWAQTRATLVAAGGNAFSDWVGRRPRPGERVIVKQYAGYTVDGKDGEKYQVCNDKDISAVLEDK